MSAAAPRVVSLVPSVTETLLAWGVSPVACTRFCEQPELPHVGGTKDPDVRAIVELRPDLVVMCVEENRRDDADALARAGVPTAALSIDGVADVAPALRRLAGLVGVDPGRVEDPATDPPGARIDRPLRAFVPIWKRPWMSLAGGTYGSSLLEAIGVENVFADAAERYPEITLDDLVVMLRGVPGVFGARVTGAGFGGCVVALCQPKTRLKVPVLWRGRPAAGASLTERAPTSPAG